jgi:hypothetical protein
MALPAVFTIYTYITKISKERDSTGTEWLVIAAGICSVLTTAVLLFGLTAKGRSEDAVHMEETFEISEIYMAYAKENKEATIYNAEILDDPASIEELDSGYTRICHYNFQLKENGLIYQCTLDIFFEYAQKEWSVSNVDEDRALESFDTISGNWKGVGEYPSLLNTNNEYVCKAEFTPEGGNGNLQVGVNGSVFLNVDFTAEIVELKQNDAETVVYMTFKLATPITYTSWGNTVVIPTLNCTYHFESNYMDLKIQYDNVSLIAYTPDEPVLPETSDAPLTKENG